MSNSMNQLTVSRDTKEGDSKSRVRKSVALSDEEKILEGYMLQMKLFVCKICDVDCGKYYGLVSHVRKDHGDQFDDYELCCTFSLKRATPDLFDHIRLHLDKDAFKCQECGKCFLNNTNLTMHKRQFHSNSTTCICDICGKGFLNVSFLNKHLKMAHGPTYKCDYCQAGKTKKRRDLVPEERTFNHNLPLFYCRVD